jgi:hypothetical protein
VLRRLILLALLPAVLQGCTNPCGGADFGHGNPAYNGTYTGVYTNQKSFGTTGAAKDLTFQIVIGPQVTGTVTEPSTGRTTSITGNAGDWESSCSSDNTWISLQFTFDGEQPRDMNGTRAIGQTQPWPFAGTYRQAGLEIGSGKLILTKQ